MYINLFLRVIQFPVNFIISEIKRGSDVKKMYFTGLKNTIYLVPSEKFVRLPNANHSVANLLLRILYRNN